MAEVWFIRHGESVSNANLPTKNPELSELTAKGHEEAKKIVAAFTKKPDLIVVSSYVRARETAVPTINHFPTVPVEEWPVHEFTYLHPERYNGTTGSDRRPTAMSYWQRSDPFENEAGGGESFAELVARIQQMIDRLEQHPAPFVAVFTHGLFIRGLIWMLLTGIREPSAKTMQRYSHFTQAVRVPNGGIFKATFEVGKPVGFSEIFKM